MFALFHVTTIQWIPIPFYRSIVVSLFIYLEITITITLKIKVLPNIQTQSHDAWINNLHFHFCFFMINVMAIDEKKNRDLTFPGRSVGHLKWICQLWKIMRHWCQFTFVRTMTGTEKKSNYWSLQKYILALPSSLIFVYISAIFE